MSDARFSPWYINTRRLSDLTGVLLSTRAQITVAKNSVERVDAMQAAKEVAQRLVASGNIPNLANLIADGSFPGSVVSGVWANASFRGSAIAIKASEKNRAAAKPAVSVQVVVNGRSYWLDGTLEVEHYYSSSSSGLLSGKKQVYIAGKFDLDKKGARGSIQPWLIGDLLEPMDILPMSLGHTADVYPGSIDAFSKMNHERPPAETVLRSIMGRIAETDVKGAFAEIIGEPYAPKGWGGERSDLYTDRLTIDGVPTTAAFLLKGPAAHGPMRYATLGKQGDQIVRLFDEPARLLVLQHHSKIETPVRKTMRQFAVDPANPRKYCIIDGADTYRILRAYGYIGSDGSFKAKRSKGRKGRKTKSRGKP